MRYCLFLLLSLLVYNDGSAQKTRKAVFVIADGIPADVIEKVNIPTLDAIGKKGGYVRAHVGGEKAGYSQTPTISAVGYNSLLTGTWVNKHNVWDNDIAAPNYNYHNLFRFFKTQYPQKKVAVFSTWLDNRTKLVGNMAAAAGNLQPDYYFDGLELDTIRYPHDKESNYIHRIDEAVTDTAAAVIKREGPDLSWVYLEYTDDMGHRYGDSKQLNEAVLMMDNQLARLWNAIQYREKYKNEEWVIYITTDHGRDASTGKNHGGQSDRERTTWIATNAKGLNDYFKKMNPGIVDIMPSIASFLNMRIPRERMMEIDGVSLTGPLSAVGLTADLNQDKLIIQWKVLDKKGNAKIWVSTTNNFKTGGTDQYQLMSEVPVEKGISSVDISQLPSLFYKVVLEMPYNFLNRWVIVKK